MAARRARPACGLALLVATCAIGLAACSTGSSSAPLRKRRTKPTPRLGLFADVTLVGVGQAAGTGDGLVRIELSDGGNRAAVAKAPPLNVGTFPAALAIAPNGRSAYVADYDANVLTPVELSTGKVGRPIAAGSGPAGVALSPDGHTAYVTDAGSTPLGHNLTPINLSTGKAGRPITVGPGPEGVAITSDGRRAFVADAGAVVAGQSGAIGHEVTEIDLVTGATRQIPVGNAPEAVAIDAVGGVVYVANANSGSITPISLANDRPGTPIPLGGAPQGIAFAPNGRTAYVTVVSKALPSGGALVAIDVATGRVSPPVAVGPDPAGVAVTPNGRTAWVAVTGANRLVPVALTSMHAGPSIAVPGGPYALALAKTPLAGRAGPSRPQGAQRARPKR
jgi:DNA-binding beta-propeller fold protein YncE